MLLLKFSTPRENYAHTDADSVGVELYLNC